MQKILIVDDSPTASRALRLALESDPGLLVVGEAATGEAALDFCQRLDPDLVTMDVHLAEESGFDVTSEIMSRSPRPILIVTGLAATEPDLACQAMAHGALDVLPKLPAPGDPDYDGQRRRLIRLVHTLASVPILHRGRGDQPAAPPPTAVRLARPAQSPPAGPREVLLIGASTGGPQIVASLLSGLPPGWRAPVIVAQHITVGFAAGLGRWLGQLLGREVVVVERPTQLEAGGIYLAPDHADLVFVARDRVAPTESAPESTVQPTIDALFESAARHVGSGVLAIVLTGMGRDGTAGLTSLAERGALTVAQAPETCTVDSMPRTAIERGVIHHTLRPEEIPGWLRQF